MKITLYSIDNLSLVSGQGNMLDKSITIDLFYIMVHVILS